MVKRKIAFPGRSLFIFAFICLLATIAFALTPKIHFITPDHGANNSPTNVTISGDNFEATPKVALYGGGPHIVGSADMPGDAGGVFVLGDYAYMADGYYDEKYGRLGHITVVDVSDPENPTITGSVGTPDDARSVFVSGNHAYVADGGSGLQVIDVSNPENPTIVGSVDTPDYASGVYVSGNYAYVGDGWSGLQVIEISNPENPTITGSVDTPGGARDVFLSGNYAYVADWAGGLQVIDISDPENPTIVGSVGTPGQVYGVFVSGNHAYVADKYIGFLVINISDPENPTITGSVDTPSFALDVYVSDNHAYVADGGSGLQVIDVSNPENPSIVGSVDTPGEASGVFVSGNYAHVANTVSGLQVVNVSDPTNPTIVGSVNTPDYASGVYVSGNYAYVATGICDVWLGSIPLSKIVNWGDLTVVDVSDPENPTIVGSASTPTAANDVFVSGNYAYVATGQCLGFYPGGFKIIDVSDPANPTIVGSVGTPDDARSVFVSGNYAYVADGETGLQVIDISDPTNPTIVGSADGDAGDVYVSGNYAYVADGETGLQVIDISDPTNPTIVGSADGDAGDVYVSGNYAYVTGNAGLQVIDISDSENPTLVGSADTPGNAGGVFVSGNYAYVGDGWSGLQVLRTFDPCTNVSLVNSSTLTAIVPAGLPEGTHNLHVVNPNGERAILPNSFTVLPAFTDVPPGFWAEDYIYKIYNAGITTGCSSDPPRYCPGNPTNRTQMAVFLERAMNGSSYTPPPAKGIFADVPLTWWAVDWIEQFYNDGITSGCRTTPLMYCPVNPVTRTQMAIFLLRAKHGGSYTPPPATGIFDDVPLTWWAVDWIEQLYREGITTGCGTNPLRYCPTDTVTRAQMAAFIVRTFGL